MSDMESLNKQEIGFLKEQITDLKREMTAGFATLNAKLEILNEHYVKREELEKYTTKEAFRPVRAIAYTIVSVLGVAALGAIFRIIFVQ